MRWLVPLSDINRVAPKDAWRREKGPQHPAEDREFQPGTWHGGWNGEMRGSKRGFERHCHRRLLSHYGARGIRHLSDPTRLSGPNGNERGAARI